MLKIAITGPECSGKSTLAAQLAEHYGTNWIREYAREYLTDLGRNYEQSDLDAIAEGQLALWNEAVQMPVTFYDTEMLVLKIWSAYKYRSVSEKIQVALQEQAFDHYFVCYPDLVWENDPLREHPNNREELFQLYINELDEMQLPYTIIKGTTAERFSQSQSIISKLQIQ